MSVINQFDLSGKVAYVTGAAQGIGAQFVQTLIEARAKVAVVDINGAALKK